MVEKNIRRKVLDAEIIAQIGYVRMFALRAKRRLPPHVELDDLVSAGYLGLMHAARGFDARKGATFRTYASVCIQGAMLEYVRHEHSRSKNYTIPVQLAPHHFKSFLHCPDFDLEIQYREARARLAQLLTVREYRVLDALYFKHQRSDHVALTLGISPGRISQIHKKALKKVSDGV